MSRRQAAAAVVVAARAHKGNGAMQIGGRNRAAIVGVGGWGARVVAHLWPRLRMADRGRSLASTATASWQPGSTGSMWGGSMRLPRLSDMVSHALVLPAEDGSLTIARPQPERWDDVSFARRHLAQLSSAVGLDGTTGTFAPYQSTRTLRETTYRALWPTLDIVGRYEPPEGTDKPPSRRWMWQHLLKYRLEVATDLAAIIEQARIDESEPDEEASQLTIFVVASLADELATAVLWPLSQLLREQIGGHVLAELVGLLSTGVYGPPPERRREEAAVHVALSELAYLIRQAAGEDGDGNNAWREKLLGPTASVSSVPPFDRTYLVDREKLSGALVKDEGELTTVVGNALEAFLAADANVYLRNVLAPDEADLLRTGPFSSLGAACIYVPLEEMWTQARQRLALDMLRDHFLAPLPDEEAAQAAELAERLAQHELAWHSLCQAILDESQSQPGSQTASLVEVAEPGSESASVEGQETLPLLRVRPPMPALREQPTAVAVALSELASRAAVIHQQFDELEGGQLMAWAAELVARGRGLLAPTSNGEEAQPQSGLLQRLDEEVLTLVTTHEQGLQLAQLYMSHVARLVRRQHETVMRQRQRWQARAEATRTTVLQQRLASAHTLPLLNRLPAWHWVVAAVALLMTLVMGLALWEGGLAPGLVVLWALTTGAGVFVVGLMARLAYRLWLRGSLRRIVGMRQQRLNALAQAALAQALEALFAALSEEVARRQRALEEAQERLRRERDLLADRLSQPLAVSHSFVRQPLAQEELYEDIRSQPARLPSSDLAVQVLRADPVSMEMIRQAWQHAVLPKEELAARNGALQGTIFNLGEALSLAIERYAARLSQPEAPADVSVQDLLPRVVPGYSPSDFLSDLRLKAKPLIRLDDQVVTSPIAIDLVASPVSGALQPTSPLFHATALRLRLLSSYDPFSLILVRTLHGLPLEAIASLRVYARAFASLSLKEKRSLVLCGALLGEPQLDKTRRRARARSQ